MCYGSRALQLQWITKNDLIISNGISFFICSTLYKQTVNKTISNFEEGKKTQTNKKS